MCEVTRLHRNLRKTKPRKMTCGEWLPEIALCEPVERFGATAGGQSGAIGALPSFTQPGMLRATATRYRTRLDPAVSSKLHATSDRKAWAQTLSFLGMLAGWFGCALWFDHNTCPRTP